MKVSKPPTPIDRYEIVGFTVSVSAAHVTVVEHRAVYHVGATCKVATEGAHDGFGFVGEWAMFRNGVYNTRIGPTPTRGPGYTIYDERCDGWSNGFRAELWASAFATRAEARAQQIGILEERITHHERAIARTRDELAKARAEAT